MFSGGGPGKAVMPAPGQSVQFRASLWSNLEKLMDDIFHVCVQTSHLHKVGCIACPQLWIPVNDGMNEFIQDYLRVLAKFVSSIYFEVEKCGEIWKPSTMSWLANSFSVCQCCWFLVPRLLRVWPWQSLQVFLFTHSLYTIFTPLISVSSTDWPYCWPSYCHLPLTFIHPLHKIIIFCSRIIALTYLLIKVASFRSWPRKGIQ